MGAPGASHQWTNVGEPLSCDDWWADQRHADEKFQERLRAAGVPEGVDTRPGTVNPIFIDIRREVRSSDKLVYPTAPSF